MRKRWWLLLTVVSATDLRAQTGGLAIFGAGSDYREQSAALAFGGRGIGGKAELAWGRFGISVTGSTVDFRPEPTAAPDLEAFKAADLEVSIRLRVASMVSLEGASIHRWVTPDRAAQALNAKRFGIRADYRLAPGADGQLRGGLVAGSTFSGGGSAKTGVSLGFGLSYGARRRGVRLIVEYDFLRINRETTGPIGTQAVPLQSSTARLGALLVF